MNKKQLIAGPLWALITNLWMLSIEALTLRLFSAISSGS